MGRSFLVATRVLLPLRTVPWGTQWGQLNQLLARFGALGAVAEAMGSSSAASRFVLSAPSGGSALRASRAGFRIVTWLILPVVICLSQRLSHACLSISNYTVKLRMAH